MSSIKLSPKYGVNPTIPVCFWCGEPKNEIAMMGRIGDGRRDEDMEAPKYSVLDFRPCEKCEANMSKGFTVMEATLEPNLRSEVEMQPGIYPTGRYVVVKPDAAKNIFPSEYLSRGKCFMDRDDFIKMFGEVVDK